MKVLQETMAGLKLIEPQVFGDQRGYFFESYNQEKFSALGIDNVFVQDNSSFSSYGTIRGLHFQKGEFAQAKLVSVVQGRVIDVVVDLRPNSPTFKKHFAVELTGENKLMLFIPRGFAHGFGVLSETALFSYKCDNFYSPQNEGGIHLSDPDLKIDWKIPDNKMIVSAKDQKNPWLKDFVS